MGKTYIFSEANMKKPKRADNKERRAAPRFPASEVLPHAVTRLATGQEVELVNLSLNGGILINTGIMLAPGSCIRLRVAIPGTALNLDGRVQRCRVVGLKQAKVQYEAVIILDERFPMPLATKLGLSSANKAPSKLDKASDINALTFVLPETAELWVINAKGA
jgi:hypothetical protein